MPGSGGDFGPSLSLVGSMLQNADGVGKDLEKMQKLLETMKKGGKEVEKASKENEKLQKRVFDQIEDLTKAKQKLGKLIAQASSTTA